MKLKFGRLIEHKLMYSYLKYFVGDSKGTSKRAIYNLEILIFM